MVVSMLWIVNTYLYRLSQFQCMEECMYNWSHLWLLSVDIQRLSHMDLRSRDLELYYNNYKSYLHYCESYCHFLAVVLVIKVAIFLWKHSVIAYLVMHVRNVFQSMHNYHRIKLPDIWAVLTWNAHIPGIPMLLVDDMLIKSGELVPVTLTKLIESPALRPTVACKGPVNPLSLL